MLKVVQRGRVQIIGIAVVAALIVALGLSTAIAQDATNSATPEAGSASAQATPEAGSNGVPSAPAEATARIKTALAVRQQQVLDTIATVEADRIKVPTGFNMRSVDDLMLKANAFADSAKTALASKDISEVPGSLLAAEQSALAAEYLMRAQLSIYGLPSQQAGTSRTLVAAYNLIDALSATVGVSDNADAKTLLTTAQTLYSAAYAEYGDEKFALAAATAQIGAQLAQVSSILLSGPIFSADGAGDVQSSAGNAGKAYPSQQASSDGSGGFIIEVVPGGDLGEPGGVIVFGAESGTTIEGKVGGYRDDGGFSTESPLEVPPPNFD